MTLPNILVLQYLKAAGGASPEILMKTEAFIRQGYQRLLTFEAQGGGFSWWGESPANVMLSAYGLLEFAEMARVIDVDPAILDRTRRWLLAKREPDGSFTENRTTHTLTTGSGPFALTAFVAWSQLVAGAPADEVAPSVSYLVSHLAAETDPYALGLALNVLTAAKRSEAEPLARRLVALGPDGWSASGATLVCSRGDAANIEVTALLALGLIETRLEAGALKNLLALLNQHRQAFGLWQTTTATVLALKAIISDLTHRGRGGPFTRRIRGTVDGKDAGEIPVSDRSYDVVQVLDLKRLTHTGEHRIALIPELSSPQVFSAQIVATAWVPHGAPPGAPPLDVQQTFDRTTLAVDDLLKATVKIVSHAPPSGSMVMVDLGVPPGFAVETAGLAALVSQGTIARYELTGRQLQLYVPPLLQDRPVTLEYALRARFPLKAATPPSVAYEYYNPANRVALGPVDLEVR